MKELPQKDYTPHMLAGFQRVPATMLDVREGSSREGGDPCSSAGCKCCIETRQPSEQKYMFCHCKSLAKSWWATFSICAMAGAHLSPIDKPEKQAKIITSGDSWREG